MNRFYIDQQLLVRKHKEKDPIYNSYNTVPNVYGKNFHTLLKKTSHTSNISDIVSLSL